MHFQETATNFGMWGTGTFLSRHDNLAVLGVLLLAVLGFVGGAAAGLQFAVSLPVMMLTPAVLGTIALGYHAIRPAENYVFQILLYASLWLILPVAGVHLSYLAVLSGMPLQSDTFVAMDKAIGFEWVEWARFVIAHPTLAWVTERAYLSHSFQPFVALVVITLFGPTGRNAQLVLATLIALAVVIAISSLVPSVQPALAHGIEMPADRVFAALREGRLYDLSYVGLINFPSFHAAMAVLFTAAYLGMPRFFWPAAMLNSVMLLSIPYTGDHYLVDIPPGMAIAALAVVIARRIVPDRPRRPAA